MRPSRTNWTIGSRCLALAALVRARAIDIRCLFHGLALGTAIFARRSHTRTNGVCALLTFCSRHFFSPGFGSTIASDPDPHLRIVGPQCLSRYGHISRHSKREPCVFWDSIRGAGMFKLPKGGSNERRNLRHFLWRARRTRLMGGSRRGPLERASAYGADCCARTREVLPVFPRQPVDSHADEWRLPGFRAALWLAGRCVIGLRRSRNVRNTCRSSGACAGCGRIGDEFP